ncbi:FecCD family ABC transporter permease [Mycolicibacterium tokaiense]|uniref:ABC transporter permease n=1 Tax=Mycolicibacterium tokaiense TaxID=39695 RepID=A0A378TFU9_9MYCO|nr:iron chelate uptake ABC transporter family permease subunit [Mycolicibacterium tokaiense]BBY85794.1 ABC transporter permease [Mycolicibacterium tokaiense]STZ59691.1 ABC transporter permease [Mycolicibacterium tokaiense]
MILRTVVDRRPGLTTVALLVLGVGLLVFSMLAAVSLGGEGISLVNVRDILGNHLQLTDIDVLPYKDVIVWQDRMPRTVVAAAVGAGLAICGVILQSLLRNPLADPFLLGISSGASTGAVVIGILGLGGSAIGLSGGAFVGALVSFGAVLLLAQLAGGSTDRVILAGIAMTQLFSALTSFVIFAFADSDETRGVLFWLLGSLEGVRWDDAWLTAAVTVVSLACCWAAARALDAFSFGDEVAASLGVSVARVRGGLLVLTAVVTAALVSVAGAVGFVGLVLPHAARFLVGPGHTRLVPVSALLGAIFLVWVDALSRLAFHPTPLPLGVGTALIGVPAFVAIMFSRRGRA